MVSDFKDLKVMGLSFRKLSENNSKRWTSSRSYSTFKCESVKSTSCGGMVRMKRLNNCSRRSWTLTQIYKNFRERYVCHRKSNNVEEFMVKNNFLLCSLLPSVSHPTENLYFQSHTLEEVFLILDMMVTLEN